jgi:hypothetical protein
MFPTRYPFVVLSISAVFSTISEHSIALTACQPGPWPTLPRRGKFAEYFPQNLGSRGFYGVARRHVSAAKKHSPGRKKIARILAAASLPQDSQVELMFGASRFGEPALSASCSLGFHIVPRGGRAPLRLGNLRKCFNRRRILNQARRFTSQ